MARSQSRRDSGIVLAPDLTDAFAEGFISGASEVIEKLKEEVF